MKNMYLLLFYSLTIETTVYKLLDVFDKYLDDGNITISNRTISFVFKLYPSIYEGKNIIKGSERIKNNLMLKQIDYSKLNKKIYEFTSCLKNKMNKDNYAILINNLEKNLSNSYEMKNPMIIIMDSCFFGHVGYTKYESEKSSIKYNLGLKIKSLQETIPFHELFHLSTIYIENNKSICGFRLDSLFGRMLNEGYTEHMREKYFGKNFLRPAKGYCVAKDIMGILEKIVGSDNMERCYLTANMNELLNLMNKYISFEESHNLIRDIELVSFPFMFDFNFARTLYTQNSYLIIKHRRVMNKYFYKIFNIERNLLKMYAVKLSQETDFSKEMIQRKTIGFFNENFLELKKIAELNEYNFQLYSFVESDILEIVDDVFEDKKQL